MTTLFFILNGISLALFVFQIVFSTLYHRKVHRKKNTVNGKPKVSVVIPYYRESNENLQKTVYSIDCQKNVDVEIILVNDGNEIPATVKSRSPLQHIHLPHNKGKRHALYEGGLHCSHPHIATIDSDTILKGDALIELYKCITSQNAHAACGNILVKNQNKNLLTRMVAAMYWFAFQMERASQSHFGMQTVCSGALSMYEATIFKKATKELIHQRVGKTKCVAGDDKHLTTQVVMNGYRTTWCPTAYAYTDTPSSLRSFIRQQIRWSRSFILESIWIFRRQKMFPFLFKVFTFKNFFKFIYMLSILSGVVFMYYHLDIFFLGLITLKALIIMIVSRRISYFFNTFVLAIFGYLLLSPIYIWAAMTCYKSEWLTRSK